MKLRRIFLFTRILVISTIFVIALSLLNVIFFTHYDFKMHYDPQVKDFITSRGDHLQLTATFRNTMHDVYLDYDICLLPSKRITGFSTDVRSTGYPDDAFETFSFITDVDGINIYELQDAFIFINDDDIYSFHIKENDKPLDYYLNYDEDIQFDVIVKPSLNAICQTKRLKYIEQCDKIFAQIHDSPVYSIAKRWLTDDITSEEIQVNQNDGYTVDDMKKWASNFIDQSIQIDH